MLVRHENPQKFESKWFGPYQVVEKKMLGTYRLQDPNGKELAALVHGNRLLKANISSAETLKKLWASPAVKDQLRRRNITAEYKGSDDPLNTELLESYLFEDDDATVETHEPTADTYPQSNRQMRPNLHPLAERELFESIVVEPPPSKRRRKQ